MPVGVRIQEVFKKKLLPDEDYRKRHDAVGDDCVTVVKVKQRP